MLKLYCLTGSAGLDKESTKLQQHLVLLREEYKKLQQHASALEARLALYSSAEKTIENGFLSRLHKTVSGLHQSAMYRYVMLTAYITAYYYTVCKSI